MFAKSSLFTFVLGYDLLILYPTLLYFDTRKNIIGGYGVKNGEYTYQVSLSYGEDHICGGAIIEDQYILTAAHCVIDGGTGSFDQERITAIIGANDLNDKGPNAKKIDIDTAYVPKLYQPQNCREGDRPIAEIAVLKLKEPIGLLTTDTKIKKLQLPENSESNYDIKKAIIAGFGYNWITQQTIDGSNEVEQIGGSHGKMRYANAVVIPLQQCRRIMPDIIYSTDICAKVYQNHPFDPEGTCTGDSGGPLVVDGTTVIGILNASPLGCNEKTSSGVYTKVASYINFVKNAVRGIRTEDMRVATWLLLPEDCENPKLYVYDH